MSIKSQRSLEEECSEIIERSYSVRTPSDESLSGSEADSPLALELLRKLSPAALSKLRRRFRSGGGARNHIDRVAEVMREAAAQEGIEFPVRPPGPVGPRDGLWLDRDGFLRAVHDVFGGPKYAPHATQLFQLLDRLGSGRVWWGQLLDRMVDEGARRTRSRVEVWSPVKVVEMKKLEHCKREPIVKLVSIEQTGSFSYAAVSRGGRMGVYDGAMQLLHCYEVFYHRTGLRRRVKNCWITDAVYFPDVSYLVLSASDRSLMFYDVTTLTHTPVYCITGLPNIPTCLSYSPGTSRHLPHLALGTESGDVITLHFLQPRVGLLRGEGEGVMYYYWMELSSPPHTSYVTISTHRRMHSRPIRRLCHTRHGDILLSCSHDSVVSMRAKYVGGLLEDCIYKVQRGITCFHSVPSLYLIATGSADGAVRLWGSSRPYAVLTAPNPRPVLDVAVVERKEILVAYCMDCYLHIWDLYEECLLQTIRVRFPFLGVLGKKIDFGNYCLFAGPPHLPYSPTPSSTSLDPPLLTSSRCGSAVLAPTGGLVMVDDEDDEKNGDDDNQTNSFNRPELILTCCDYICRVSLTATECGPVVPPPGDTQRSRRPSGWDLDDDDIRGIPAASLLLPSPLAAHPPPLSPAAPADGIDTLLQKAGLQGILEKDFVLMQGLKSDLNKKLLEMQRNMDHMLWACGSSAPHLAARLVPPHAVEPADNMADRYHRVMSLFPPIDSKVSTPREGSRQSSRRS